MNICSILPGLSLLWTHGNPKGLTLPDLVRLLCHNTAKLAGVSHRKGHLTVGHDADLVVWDPSMEWTVSADSLLHKNKVTTVLQSFQHLMPCAV